MRRLALACSCLSLFAGCEGPSSAEGPLAFLGEVSSVSVSGNDGCLAPGLIDLSLNLETRALVASVWQPPRGKDECDPFGISCNEVSVDARITADEADEVRAHVRAVSTSPRDMSRAHSRCNPTLRVDGVTLDERKGFDFQYQAGKWALLGHLNDLALRHAPEPREALP